MRWEHESYSGLRVLVTGHTGFKGSWLTFMLDSLGAHVSGFASDVPAEPRHAYYSLGIPEIVGPDTVVGGDIADVDALKEWVHSTQADLLFHLAAQPLVSEAYLDPLKTFRTNTLGTLHVTEALRTRQVPLPSVLITSDKCYQNVETLRPYTEQDRMGGDDPYSASKGAAELVVHSYLTSYPGLGDVGLATARAGNVFGGGDWSTHRLIPDCVRDLEAERTPQLRMPAAVRPWTHVADILNGYLLLGARLRNSPRAYSENWNFSSGETLTVRQVATTIAAAFGQVLPEEAPSDSGIGKESQLLLLDSGKARAKLNWWPHLGLRQSLAEVADWYRRQALGADMRVLSSEQIVNRLGLGT